MAKGVGVLDRAEIDVLGCVGRPVIVRDTPIIADGCDGNGWDPELRRYQRVGGEGGGVEGANGFKLRLRRYGRCTCHCFGR